MESTRQKKIARLLQKEISDVFMKEAKEYTIGALVTVSVVRVTPDLGLAKVYLSIFPGDKVEGVFNTIEENNHHIRFALGKRVGKQLRIIPELKFYVDDTLDYVENIDRLLNE